MEINILQKFFTKGFLGQETRHQILNLGLLPIFGFGFSKEGK